MTTDTATARVLGLDRVTHEPTPGTLVVLRDDRPVADVMIRPIENRCPTCGGMFCKGVLAPGTNIEVHCPHRKCRQFFTFTVH